MGVNLKNMTAYIVLFALIILVMLVTACGSGGTTVGVDSAGTIAVVQDPGPLQGTNTTVLDPTAPAIQPVGVNPPVGVACPIFDANGNIICSCESLRAGNC